MSGVTPWVTYFGSFLLVLMLLGVTLWLLRKASSRMARGPEDAVLHLIESRSLGPRHRLVLVSASGRKVLVGLSPQGMTLLDVDGSSDCGPRNPVAGEST